MSIIIPSNKKGLEDVKAEVKERGLNANELLLSIDTKLTEIILHLRTITGEDFKL